MAFTQTQLEAIEKAIAEGVLKVKYENKEVEYRSLDDLLKLRDLIKAELGLSARGGRRYVSTNKGLQGGNCE
jgi:hypothetical protein